MRLTAFHCPLIILILTTIAPACFAQYIPVGIVLEQRYDNPPIDNTSSIDPIVSELAIHIDQQYAPLIASRQLVHRLIRHKQLCIESKNNPATKLGGLLKHLKNYTNAHAPGHDPQLINDYQARPTDKELLSITPAAETQPKLFSEIHQCVSDNPHIISHLFLLGLPLERWQIYQVMNKKNPAQSSGLYVLLPPTTNAQTKARIERDTGNFLNISFASLTSAALFESPDVQLKDAQRQISAHAIVRALRALQQHATDTHSQSKLIISLGGHGRYSRSSYGIIIDRLKCVEFDQLPTIDKTAHEPKDTTGSIAGLKLPEFRKLLGLLNKKVATQFLYYAACYTGNHHLITPYTNKDGSPLLLNYTVATPSMDSGVISHDYFHIGINPADPVNLQIACPMDPKSFFQQCDAWCTSTEKAQKSTLLQSAFLAMIGNEQRNNSMLREQSAPQFTPLLAPDNLHITPESLLTAAALSTLSKTGQQLFLGHNNIDTPIKASMPLIRSTIPTNSTHYIKEMECTDANNGSVLEILTHIFFNKYNQQSVNRMIFFIKTLKLITQGKTHILHDLFVLHNVHSATLKNSFVIWRNHKKNTEFKHRYSFAQSIDQRLSIDPEKEFLASWAHQTPLYYIGLDTREQSYIDAPTLTQALPQAYDDTAIRTFCAQTYKAEKCNRKAIKTIWKLLGY